jgi:beta-glucosidase
MLTLSSLQNFGWQTLNGTLVTGGGSGSNTPSQLVSPFEAIQQRLRADRGTVRWDFASVNPTVYANAEACLVFINAYASESFDRTSLKDDFSDRLVKNVARNCTNTMVVIHSAGIRVVDEWVNNENVTAILYALLPGEESGNSIADVLYGDVSPSGRLPFTVAKNESDYGALLNSTVSYDPFPQDNFTEGLYIDYRHFDKYNITPQYEFGFGLSYSNFSYSDLSVNAVGSDTSEWPAADVAIVQGGHPALWEALFNVTVKITNTGEVNAAEVPQLYISIPTAPQWQLRGFGRINLEAGQSDTVTFTLTRKDLSVWNVVHQQWQLQQGEYEFFVGSSSRKSLLEGSLKI